MADTERNEGAEEGDLDQTYEPSRTSVNNSRIQGLGVGQKDMDYQGDPTRRDSAEKYADEGGDQGKTRDPGRRSP